MLKRSFAESRAQMAAPELLTQISQGREQMAALQQQPWSPGGLGTTREDVEAFHEASVRLQDLILQMQVWSDVFMAGDRVGVRKGRGEQGWNGGGGKCLGLAKRPQLGQH